MTGPLTAQASTAGYAKAAELGAVLDKTATTCPDVAKHLDAVVAKGHSVKKGFPQKTYQMPIVFKFEKKAKDLFFDSSSGTIYLPVFKKGDEEKGLADPVDLVDGLIFESCNVEMAQTFVALTARKRAALLPTRGEVAPEAPVNMTDYGRQKSDAEAASTLKDCELKLAMLKSGAPMAGQGKRNFASMFGTLMAAQGTPVEGLAAIIGDPVALDRMLGERTAEIDGAFQAFHDGTIPVAAVCDLMAKTPHKVEAGPDDPASLPTAEAYFYEEIEQETARCNALALLGDLKSAMPAETLRNLAPLVRSVVEKLDLPVDPTDRDANINVARIKYLRQLQEILTAKTGASFPSMAFTPAMLDLSEQRIANAKAKSPDFWAAGADERSVEKTIADALTAFSAELDRLFPKAP